MRINFLQIAQIELDDAIGYYNVESISKTLKSLKTCVCDSESHRISLVAVNK